MEHTNKDTHIFVLLEVLNRFMNDGEFFRLDVNNEFVQLWVIGYVVQGNCENLVSWEKHHKFFHVFLDGLGFCIRNKTFFEESLFLAYWDYIICSELATADKTRILRGEFWFKI